ncbi:MAG: hypothetical protein ABSD44_00730 [Terracidiphilus sp.]
MSFSAACKAQHLLAELTARLKSCPDASCNLHGILQVAPKKAALERKDPLFVAKKAVFAAPKGWRLGADFHDAGKIVRIRAHRVFLVKVRFAQQSLGDSGVSCNFFLSGGELICKVLKINIGGVGELILMIILTVFLLSF